MITRKFNTFEYVGWAEGSAMGKQHVQETFESAGGHAFVIASGSVAADHSDGLAKMAVDRIKYYIDQEAGEQPEELVKNALIYSSGFIYQHCKKASLSQPDVLDCICAFFSGQTFYAAWIGEASVFLYNGKKLIPLGGKDQSSGSNGFESMGGKAMVLPATLEQPLVPLSGDFLLMGSGPIFKQLPQKQTRKILQDSMPVQTKLARLMRMHDLGKEGGIAATQLINFYNLNNTDRSFEPGSEQVTSGNKPSTVTKHMATKQTKHKSSDTTKRYTISGILSLLILLALAYMVYDLFIKDPHPPVEISERPISFEEMKEMTDEEYDATRDAGSTVPVIPDDIPYTVRGGDTWSRLYIQYSVCSWFIINHPPNRNRFGANGALISGQRLQIPVRYSADRGLNPYFHQEFSTDKVGSGCQHAGQEMLDAFQEKIRNIQ